MEENPPPRHQGAKDTGVAATARLTGKKAGGETINETHELDCALIKTGDGWRFTNIKAAVVLKK
jgi:hypothetical protein